MAKYSQKLIDKTHNLKESGLTIKEVSKKIKFEVRSGQLYSV